MVYVRIEKCQIKLYLKGILHLSSRWIGRVQEIQLQWNILMYLYTIFGSFSYNIENEIYQYT